MTVENCKGGIWTFEPICVSLSLHVFDLRDDHLFIPGTPPHSQSFDPAKINNKQPIFIIMMINTFVSLRNPGPPLCVCLTATDLENWLGLLCPGLTL